MEEKMRKYVKILLSLFIGTLIANWNITSAVAMQSIKEMQELENIKWKRTYEAYGRNINVDVFIDIPNVKSIPIINVEAYKAVKSDTLNRSEYALKQIEEDGWSLYYEEPFLGEYLDNTLGAGRISIADEKQNNDGDYFHATYNSPDDTRTNGMKYESDFFYPYDMEFSEIYAEDNPNSLQHAIEYFEKMIGFFYPEENSISVKKVEVRSRAHRVKGLDDYKLGEYVDNYPMGTYNLEIRQKIEGVPVYISVRKRMDARAADKVQDAKKKINGLSAMDAAYYEYMSDDSFDFLVAWLKKQEIVENDVPLEEVNNIIDTIEEKIMSGNIRNVYSLRLGYCVYLNDDSPESYTLYPVWLCECDYAESSKEEFRTVPHEDEENKLHRNNISGKYYYKQLVINAQTGIMDDIFITENEQAYCPQVITWESLK